jgi:hypothetical protein
MMPLLYGISETTYYGTYFATKPTSTTQAGFDSAFYFRASKNDGTALTSGNIFEVYNSTTKLFGIGYDGNAVVRNSLYCYNTDETTTGAKLLTGT